MLHTQLFGRSHRMPFALALATVLVLSSALVASANVALTQISSDPFTNKTSQHRTQVEPDTFSFGSTIVSAFQSGRFFDGGASDIGFATSTNGGASWTHGFLPGITKVQNAANPYDRVSDPTTAFDPKHNVWMISTIALNQLSNGGILGAAVLANRSTNGGLTWSNPVTIAAATGNSNLDKNWTVCDTWASSPFFGNCYTEYDDFGNLNQLHMTTSTDGGLTWKQATVPGIKVIGGQPVVQPNGHVVVPIDNAFETSIMAVVSTDGGKTFQGAVGITGLITHQVAGGLRSGPLPSAEVDGGGKVYVVWEDCRFEKRCAANDIVMSTSSDGLHWTQPVRIPIDPIGSGVDHFIPGLAVDKSTSGTGAHLGLTYYFYPNANCTASTCQLNVGFISSANGGASWSTHTQLAGPMSLNWLANTSQGRMVGDYISTSFNASGLAHGVFEVATAPSGSTFNEATFTNASGLAALGGTVRTPAGEQPVTNASDHAAPTIPVTIR